MAEPLPTDLELLRKMEAELSAHVAWRERIAVLEKMRNWNKEEYYRVRDTNVANKYLSILQESDNELRKFLSLPGPPMPLAVRYIDFPFAHIFGSSTPEQMRKWREANPDADLHAAVLNAARFTHSRVVDAIENQRGPETRLQVVERLRASGMKPQAIGASEEIKKRNNGRKLSERTIQLYLAEIKGKTKGKPKGGRNKAQ